MILIADSGSTKCDWVLLNDKGGKVFKARTLGLNPDALTTQMLHKRLAQSEEIAHISQEVDHIYFYGAGCGTSKNRHRLKRFFEKYFRRAECEVHEDLMAASLSVTTQPGIVCILGTGSNSCFFNGIKTHTTAPSLGYLVMDEASGNYFGRKLLQDYFYKRMPIDIAKKFQEEFNIYPQEIKNHLYKEKNPNVYLSNFTKLIFNFNPLPAYFKDMLKAGIQKFIDNWVTVYPQAKEVPIHFVGSVAYYSREVIAELMIENGLTLGEIEQHPIDGLVNYFSNKIKAATY